MAAKRQTYTPCRECGYKVYLVDYGEKGEGEKRGGGRGLVTFSEEGQRVSRLEKKCGWEWGGEGACLLKGQGSQVKRQTSIIITITETI